MIPMPAPDSAILAKRTQIQEALRALMDRPSDLISEDLALKVYETDGLSAYRQLPLAVALPRTTEEVARLLAYCHQQGIKVIGRGSGTSLAGGALPTQDALVLGLSKMNQVLDIDYDNRCARVQAGVTNINVSNAVEMENFFYAPDPSSQLACTIAGNVAMNSGGAHCLKYGVTTNNLLGLTVVLMDGRVVTIGSEAMDGDGYDLLGLFTGSEGMLGLVTEVLVRILPKPEGARPMLVGFKSEELAGACVAEIIGQGIVPVAIEFMDKPAILASEAFAKAGYPTDAQALLIIEVEGSTLEIEAQEARIQEIAGRYDPVSIKLSENAAQAEAIWRGRKSAFGAMGQISPDYLCMDGTIPTGKLPEVLSRIKQVGEAYGFQIANIFHAGDGNLHPLILYDANAPGEIDRVEAAGEDILKICVEVGGCITGEHGVGIEKRDAMMLMFNETDLQQQMRIKRVFDPLWLLNGAKVFPLDINPADTKGQRIAA